MVKTIDFPDGSKITVNITNNDYICTGNDANDFARENYKIQKQHTRYLSLIAYLLDIGDIKQCTICGEYFDGTEAGEYCSEKCERKSEFSDMEDQSNGVTEKY
jgi:hypothetical protein